MSRGNGYSHRRKTGVCMIIDTVPHFHSHGVANSCNKAACCPCVTQKAEVAA
jgi:hypothetical protein